MNILIPHQWLLEHLETDADPKTIQANLSLCGPSVERIYEKEGESVYDIEVTTNRVDSMSVRGIAREAATILPQFGIAAKLKPLKLATPKVGQNTLPLPKITNNPELNKRTICVVLSGVTRNATPEWMAKRLLQTDMNVHDAVIDITNYVTHELGHPCHAFDYDKLMNTGGEINIVEAQKGETFTTLDGNTFETVGGEVVFKNGRGDIIDLPSIKGTGNTSIDESTQNVLLLFESIRADKVRFASMTHAIRTVAAQLMEKHVDPHLAEDVLYRGVELYQELCDSTVASEVYDDFSGKRRPVDISIEYNRIAGYLGLEIPAKKIKHILESLGCNVHMEAVPEFGALKVTPPTFRPDLNISADIIEEIARIYGYHNLPSKIMATPIPLEKPEGVNFDIENKIKHFLADIGWQEVYTYSMVSEELALQSGQTLAHHLKLQNALTDDKVYLRVSLLPSLSDIILQNPNVEQLSVFEVANVYLPQNGTQLPEEHLTLGLVSNQDYRAVKGELEMLLERLFVKKVAFKPIGDKNNELVQKAHIVAGSTELGKVGILPNGFIGVSISIPQLLTVVHSHPEYQPLPKTAPVIEDLTFTLPEKTLVGEVVSTIKTTNPLVHSVALKDVYEHNFTFTVEYLDPTANLSAESVQPVRHEIVKLVQKKYQATLVGAL